MPERRFATLAEWLAWQETLHHSEIELGLERVRRVAATLLELPPRYPVLTVAGTNGKGSVLAYLQAMFGAAGYRTGLFTSPHLLRYNERVAVNGKPASDEDIVSAFAAIDAARADVSLTYFEFSALAALLIFQRSEVDIGLLEVGMGGRLDAVNIIAPDVAVITNVGLDHQAWLGEDREAIGREKAGIMRAGRPAVCGDPDPPRSVLAHARETGAQLWLVNADYRYERHGASWSFDGDDMQLHDLPLPALRGDVQLGNAALALAALHRLGERVPVAARHIRHGLGSAILPGRIELVGQAPEWVFDVSHNEESVQVLVRWLAANRRGGRTRLVLAMLRDKDAEAVGRALSEVVDDWYLAGLPGNRGMQASELAGRLEAVTASPMRTFATVREACRQAAGEAYLNDRIVVCGSFQTVGAARELEL